MSKQDVGAGRGETVTIQDVHFNLFKALYLTKNQYSEAYCYGRVKAYTDVDGEILPSLDSFKRRLEREVSTEIMDLHRKPAAG